MIDEAERLTDEALAALEKRIARIYREERDALEAQALGCSYITAGHVFVTDCKKGQPGRGLIFLRNVCSAVQIPVYGIGGIDAGNISEVRKAGASGACLMSSLMASENVPELIKSMEEAK